jgi:DNA repair protein RadC
MKSIKHCRVHVTREVLNEEHAPYAKLVSSSRDVAKVARSLVEHEEQEVFIVFFLDQRNRITGYNEVARGTGNACAIIPRDVFRSAVLQGAQKIIVMHNHPSGDPTPSEEDIACTRRLARAAELIGIDILDHIIIGQGERYSSFLDLGLLTGAA